MKPNILFDQSVNIGTGVALSVYPAELKAGIENHDNPLNRSSPVKCLPEFSADW